MDFRLECDKLLSEVLSDKSPAAVPKMNPVQSNPDTPSEKCNKDPQPVEQSGKKINLFKIGF